MERRSDLDFAKGVAIILMVLGHAYSNDAGSGILCWLYSFHMPLFFVIPGVLYNGRDPLKTASLPVVIGKKAGRLLVPYFAFSIINCCVLCVIGRKSLGDFGTYLYRIFALQGINAMWFIPCFLFSELVFMGLAHSKYPAAARALGSAIGLCAVSFPVLAECLPMLQRLIVGVSFICLGSLLAQVYAMGVKFPVCCLMFALHILLSSANGQVDLAYGVYNNPFLYYVNGLLGTFVLIRLYHFIDKSIVGSSLCRIGRNTMPILCTSSFVIEILRLADYKLFGNCLPALGIMEGPVLCAIVIAAEILIIRLCNRYLYFLFGMQKRSGI